MKIIHVVENLDDEYGGPARSVANLAANMRALGYRSHLYSVAWRAGESNEVIKREGLNWHQFGLLGPRKVGLSPALHRALARDWECEDRLIHLHNLWTGVSLSAFAAATRRNVPFVVSPRGALYRWCLAQGRVRKWLAWKVFQKRALERAALIHVTEEFELQRVRELGIRTPVAVVPNCVEQMPAEALERWLTEREQRRGRRVFLFLSRVHKKKGIDLLLKAWSDSKAPRMGAILRIAGPAEPRYQRELDALVARLAIRGSVEFIGMVRRDHRQEEFLGADVFVLPSHTENFGVAIAEALARGLPVVTTTGTPWQAIRERDAGWWIDLAHNNLVAALNEAATRSRSELRKNGEMGIAIIAKDYGCNRQAKDMARAYEWVSGGARPSFLDAPPDEQ